MNRLVYLYVSNGSSGPDNIPKWSPELLSVDSYTRLFPDEGFCYLFHKFLERGLFDEILVVIESSRSPGYFQISANSKIMGLVVPHISELKRFMFSNDILWVRGGWRGWWEFLEKWHNLGRWLLFYRAASNRGAWKFWDIVLDDLINECSQDGIGRFYYPINKPINPNIFFPSPAKISYDLMIGASHIHDKKGQFKILPILMEYRKQFGTDLRCVMPGSIKHGVGTSNIITLTNRFNLDINLPGMVERHHLKTLLSMSSLFVHLGGAGQNDRGPLEAMSCGTPVMLSQEKYHAPCIHSVRTPFSFHVNADEPALAARQINYALKMTCDEFRTGTYDYYQSVNGVDNIIYPQFATLFEDILQTPHEKRQNLFNKLLPRKEEK